VIHNFSADGFASLYPKYKGGRPRTFTLPERREIKKIAESRPAEHDLPFSTWSLAKLAGFPGSTLRRLLFWRYLLVYRA
jgi:transposase